MTTIRFFRPLADRGTDRHLRPFRPPLCPWWTWVARSRRGQDQRARWKLQWNACVIPDVISHSLLTAQLVHGFLVERYGERDARSLVRDARERYAELLPRVPWVSGRRGAAFNSFLGITAQELSVYQAVEARGGTASEAWEVCHQAIRLGSAQIPAWKRWLTNRLLFSWPVRLILRRRAAKEEILRAGDFQTRSLVGDGKSFDFGVDYLRCGNLELARKVGADDFAPYVCMSDIALSDAFGWGLIRTQTLADGCSHCDFRFKQGRDTCVSSRTAEVQETIDRIALGESHEAGTVAMAREHPNVALLKRIDVANIAGSADVFAKDVVWRFFNPRLPEIQGEYRGLSGLAEFFENIAKQTEGTFAVHPVSATAVGDELVVAHTRNSMTLGDRHVETDVVVVWRVVDGRVTEVWDIPSVRHG